MQPLFTNSESQTYAQDETQTDPTLPPTEKKSGFNIAPIFIGIGIALALALSGGENKTKKGLSGIEDNPGLLGTKSTKSRSRTKAKSKAKKTTKAKKSYTIKIK